MNYRTRKFLSYYRPHLKLLAADMACAFVIAAIALVLPLCARYITQNVLSDPTSDPLSDVYWMGGLMLTLVALYTACNMFVDYRGHMMGAMMEGNLRRELFEHYQSLSFSFYDRERTGQLMSRITNDLLSLAELYHHGPEDVLIAVVTLVGVFAITFALNPLLATVVFLIIPVMTLYALHFNRRMIAALARSRARVGDINAQVEESLAGVRVTKAFANEWVEVEKFNVENDRFLQSRRDAYRSEAWFSSGLICFTQLIMIVVIVFGGVAVSKASLDLPDLLAFLLYVGILTDPIRRLANFARLYQEGVTGFNRFMEMMGVEPEIRDRPGAVSPSQIAGQVKFRDVSFRYGEDQPLVLDNMNLDIEAGEYIALVGATGAGKSTMAGLIPRFYDVTGGQLLVDGIDVRNMTGPALHAAIGIVQQDPYLFSGSVIDNIRYGRLDASEDEVILAARMADAHGFIEALKDGYHTHVGQRGVRLSGGQKQRISIARVFLKNPSIVIFDEATSALDNESERAVQVSMERLAEKRTMIVIAHRLSTVRRADRILVLSQGTIAEQGTHEKLIASNGWYARLHDANLRI